MNRQYVREAVNCYELSPAFSDSQVLFEKVLFISSCFRIAILLINQIEDEMT